MALDRERLAAAAKAIVSKQDGSDQAQTSKSALEDRDDVTRLDEALPGGFPFDRDAVLGPHHGSIVRRSRGR